MKTSLTKIQLLHMIQENLINIFYPGNYLTFLKQLCYFREESIENIILIFAQYPTATYVLTYKAWQRYHRTVRRGYTAISLLSNSNSNEQLRAVFDITHTVGKEFIPKHIDINISQFRRILIFLTSKVVTDTILSVTTDDISMQTKHALQRYIYHLIKSRFSQYYSSEIEM